MSKRKQKKIKKEPIARPVPKTATAPKASVKRETVAAAPRETLIFSSETLKWIALGFLVMGIGYFLMSGGRGDDPNVFDESVIYSFRKVTLAPIFILGGLGVVTYAIFKK